MEEKKRLETSWDRLKKNLEGKHAKRMDAALETMPEEEFVTIYPRLLEHVAPKLQRSEVGVAEESNEITITHVVTSKDELQDN